MESGIIFGIEWFSGLIMWWNCGVSEKLLWGFYILSGGLPVMCWIFTSVAIKVPEAVIKSLMVDIVLVAKCRKIQKEADRDW
jgi:hypothetical protein